jgi:Flp pilus assembly pilin Flp
LALPANQFLREEENMKTLYRFLRDEQGQDLVEYTLLLAFVALAAAGIMTTAGTSIDTIWQSANTELNDAAGVVP